MTYDSERNETELGRCLLGCGHKEDSAYDTLPQILMTTLVEKLLGTLLCVVSVSLAIHLLCTLMN